MITKIKRFEALQEGGYYESVELQRNEWETRSGRKCAQWRVVSEAGETPGGEIISCAAYFHDFERDEYADALAIYTEQVTAIERCAVTDDCLATDNYTTLSDVVAYEVIPALGDFADDFDAEAIAREAFEMKTDGLRCWYVQREGVDFLEIAQNHDITGGKYNA